MNTEKKIKLIWKFYGDDALNIAEHHLIHLKEYISKENIDVIEISTELVNDMTAISFVIIESIFLENIRQNLKPNEGYLVN